MKNLEDFIYSDTLDSLIQFYNPISACIDTPTPPVFNNKSNNKTKLNKSIGVCIPAIFLVDYKENMEIFTSPALLICIL